MNKIKIIFSAVAVFAVVSSALAFGTFTTPNVMICNASSVCVLPPGPGLSTINGTNPRPVGAGFFIGAVGQACALPTDPCKPLAANTQVFVNN